MVADPRIFAPMSFKKNTWYFFLYFLVFLRKSLEKSWSNNQTVCNKIEKVWKQAKIGHKSKKFWKNSNSLSNKQKSLENIDKVWKTVKQLVKQSNKFGKNMKKVWQFLLKFWYPSGAKDCKSCRSRKMLLKMSIWLQKSASIQKRTSPLKFDHFRWKIGVRFDIESFN